ncbi:MAG: TIGR02186 family protein [Pseudomonadota bacterium]
MLIRAALLLILSLMPAQAEQVLADLSQNRVAITTSFEGSDIFVYGAVSRISPPPADEGPLEVIVEIVGPVSGVMVRRKERKLGIWVNTDAVEVDKAPHFVAIASTGPLEEVVSFTEMMRHGIGYEHTVKLIDAPADIEDVQEFRRAAIRIREAEGLYRQLPGTVKLTNETLFSTSIDLPSNLVEGDYTARVFLMRDKAVLDNFETTIAVRKAGLERWIYTLAHEQPLIYGILSILVALFAGWGAAQVFALIRR